MSPSSLSLTLDPATRRDLAVYGDDASTTATTTTLRYAREVWDSGVIFPIAGTDTACKKVGEIEPERVDADSVPTTLDDLIRMLKEELGPHGLDAEDVDVSRVLGLMEAYQSNATDWAQYALFDPYRYTRNLVDDGNGRFNLMILCWSPGHISPIHDHANAHCCMKMLEGELVETRFDNPNNSASMPLHAASDDEAHGSRLHMSGKRVLEHNKVAYISDKIGLHRVSNASDRPAVSLHLYTPPFQTCKTFCERTGIARPVSQCVFYSRMGHRCPTLSGAVTEPKEGIAGGNSASIENDMVAAAPTALPFAKDGMPIALCTARPALVASRQG